MQVLRTALAVGALAMSVPVFAQEGRAGWDRSRTEGSRDTKGNRSTDRGDQSGGRDRRSEGRVANRSESRTDNRTGPRTENRGGDRASTRSESRNAPVPDIRYERRDRRDEPRVIVRAPVVTGYDRRDGRVESPYASNGRRSAYHYGDRDFRARDAFTITAWFNGLGPSRLSAYGVYDRDWYRERSMFRPGLYLSMTAFSRLSLLPYDIEMELGELPWYLERRIYGRTVLVIDVRTRMILDIYDIDY